MRLLTFTLPIAIVLTSCTSPPKPPTVDPSLKRPANASSAVELQVCKGELQNTRIRTAETTRQAQSATATANRLALAYQASLSSSPSLSDEGNAIYTVLFPFGSTDVKISEPAAGALIERARKAALIVMRGRTDGERETPAESRVARDRAAAVRSYLVQAGVDPNRMRTTYQPVGDFAAENGTPAGRSLNRRVEIELYSVAPKAPIVVGPSRL